MVKANTKVKSSAKHWDFYLTELHIDGYRLIFISRNIEINGR